jgi:TetR/AcrR family transcriptional regulator, transcriptional repressor for nem operon
VDSRQAAKPGPKPKPDTRNNLVQAGLRLFHAEGYAATGIQTIVESVGVPKGSFYNHFESKEVFAAAVIDAYFERSEERLRTFLCESDISPLARLEAYFDDRIKTVKAAGFIRGCLMGNFSAEAADHSALMRGRLVMHFGAWSNFFENCISEAQQQGAISDQFPAALLGRFVLNSWEGALLRMRVEKSAAPLSEFKKIVFEKLLA